AGSRLAFGPDGKIIVVGAAGPDINNQHLAIARLNQDGSLDTSFNTTGTATVAFNLGGATGPIMEGATGVVVQPDRKIVVVGGASVASTGGTNPSAHAVVARLNADGTLDTSFNSTGKLDYTYNLGGSNNDLAAAVALQGTQIVIAGMSIQQFPP